MPCLQRLLNFNGGTICDITYTHAENVLHMHASHGRAWRVSTKNSCAYRISVPPAVASKEPPGRNTVASIGAPCSTVIVHCTMKAMAEMSSSPLLGITMAAINEKAVSYKGLYCRMDVGSFNSLPADSGHPRPCMCGHRILRKCTSTYSSSKSSVPSDISS